MRVPSAVARLLFGALALAACGDQAGAPDVASDLRVRRSDGAYSNRYRRAPGAGERCALFGPLSTNDDGNFVQCGEEDAGLTAKGVPLRCEGVVVDGLDAGSWAFDLGGFFSGERLVTVSWPPVDGVVRWIEDAPPPAPEAPSRAPWPSLVPTELPDACAALVAPDAASLNAESLNAQQLIAYAEANPELTGLGWMVGDVFVLPVRSDALDEVRDALGADAGEPCLVPVPASRAQLEADVDRLVPNFDPITGPITELSSGNASNRVRVTVLVADGAAVRSLTAQVDHPEALVVTGEAEILG